MFEPYSDDFHRIRWLPLLVARPSSRSVCFASDEPDSPFKFHRSLLIYEPGCSFITVSCIPIGPVFNKNCMVLNHFNIIRSDIYIKFDFSFSSVMSLEAHFPSTVHPQISFQTNMSLRTHLKFSITFVLIDFNSSAYEPTSSFIISGFPINFILNELWA